MSSSSFRILGESWVESGEAPDWQRLADRIEVDVWAWGRGLESWLVEHVVIEGDPERAESWAALDTLLGRSWPHPPARGCASRGSPSTTPALARAAAPCVDASAAITSITRSQKFADDALLMPCLIAA